MSMLPNTSDDYYEVADLTSRIYTACVSCYKETRIVEIMRLFPTASSTKSRYCQTIVVLFCILVTFFLALAAYANEKFYVGSSDGPPDVLMHQIPTFDQNVIADANGIENFAPDNPTYFGYHAETILQSDIVANHCQLFIPVYAEKDDFEAETPLPPVSSHVVYVELLLISGQSEVEIASTSFTVESTDHIPFNARVPLTTNLLPSGSTLQLRLWSAYDSVDNIWMIRSRALLPQITFINYQGDINHDDSVDLGDVILSLQTVISNQPQGEIYTDADISGDQLIGLADAVGILKISSGDRCSSNTPWYCHDQVACSAIGGFWSSGSSKCLYYSGGWSGTWQSLNSADTGTLYAMLYQTETTIEGDIQYTQFGCWNNSPLDISGIISNDFLDVTSTQYTCPDGIGRMSYTEAVISGNELSGNYDFTINGTSVDNGTFLLIRQ